jgi:galactokinase
MEVPSVQSLHEIYPEASVKAQSERWNRLLRKFKDEYGRLPDFVSRSPGRVNIIGEVHRSLDHGSNMLTI